MSHTHETVLRLALTSTSPIPLIIEKECGCTSQADIRWWRREPDGQPPADFALLDSVDEEPILDIGSGTGRHVEHLRARGLDAIGIDSSPSAIALARQAGVPCEIADVWDYTPTRRFRTVTAFGGNLGIAGHRERLDGFLSRLASFLEPGGTLILTSVDWQKSTDPHQSLDHTLCDKLDYPGNGERRLHYGAARSQWFEWIRVAPGTLAEQVKRIGMRSTLISYDRYGYATKVTG